MIPMVFVCGGASVVVTIANFIKACYCNRADFTGKIMTTLSSILWAKLICNKALNESSRLDESEEKVSIDNRHVVIIHRGVSPFTSGGHFRV